MFTLRAEWQGCYSDNDKIVNNYVNIFGSLKQIWAAQML